MSSPASAPAGPSARSKKLLVPKVWKRPHSTIYGKNVEFGKALYSDKIGEINGRKFNSELPWQVRNSGAGLGSTGPLAQSLAAELEKIRAEPRRACFRCGYNTSGAPSVQASRLCSWGDCCTFGLASLRAAGGAAAAPVARSRPTTTNLLPMHACQLASSPYGASADGRKLSLGSINPHSYRPSLPQKSSVVHASDGEEFEFQDRSSPFYTDRWAGKTIRHFDSDLYSNANLFKSMIL